MLTKIKGNAFKYRIIWKTEKKIFKNLDIYKIGSNKKYIGNKKRRIKMNFTLKFKEISGEKCDIAKNILINTSSNGIANYIKI